VQQTYTNSRCLAGRSTLQVYEVKILLVEGSAGSGFWTPRRRRAQWQIPYMCLNPVRPALTLLDRCRTRLNLLVSHNSTREKCVAEQESTAGSDVCVLSPSASNLWIADESSSIAGVDLQNCSHMSQYTGNTRSLSTLQRRTRVLLTITEAP
jgi:hypothetical protein